MTNKEAIKILYHFFQDCRFFATDKEWKALWVALKAIKTVDDHTKMFEWCTGCKEYDKKEHCCHRWNKTIQNTLAESQEYYKSVKQERDIAIKQLNSIGVKLGDDMTEIKNKLGVLKDEH